MPQHLSSRPRRRSHKLLRFIGFLGFLGLVITFILLRERGREAALVDRATTPQLDPLEIPRLVPDTLAELYRCSGAQFDPICVGAFREAFESGAIELSPGGALAR